MRNLSSLLLSFGIALSMVTTLVAQTSQGSATVVRIKGSARYSEGGSWKQLKVGDELKPGALVQTGVDKGSYVDLVMGNSGGHVMNTARVASFAPSIVSAQNTDVVNYMPQAEQSVVRLNENTALGIDKMSVMNTGSDMVTDTQLDLKQGRITGNVKKLSPGSRYEIKLPNGVAGIRGTLFDISADGVVKVAEGSVVVAYTGADGNVVTQVVNANQQFDARTGTVTTLSSGAFRDITGISSQMMVRGGNQQTEMVVDRTLYRISPVTPQAAEPDSEEPAFEDFGSTFSR